MSCPCTDKYHDDDNGVKWHKGFYRWSGVTNPNRVWWQFWKPRKASILLTFYYHHLGGELHVSQINLEIVYD